MQEDQRSELIKNLNFLTDDEKIEYWLQNQIGCKYTDSIKSGQFEFNWFHFTNQNIWMCKIYDFEQAKRGLGFVREVLFFKDKENLVEIYKQWSPP